MKHIIAIAALALTACSPLQTHYPSQATPTTHENVVTVDVTFTGGVKVSEGIRRQHLAIDGKIDTWWDAEGYAPQWLEVELHQSRPVQQIELVVKQESPGPATHKIRLENESGDMVVWHRFDTEMAADGDTFVLKIDPPQQIDKVRILTTRHQGWVAYREVRILARYTLPESVSISAIGLSRPVFLTHAGDGSGRLFVLEKEGRIRIVKNGALLAAPFLDISQKVSHTGEIGLLGLAFPSSYAERGRFYTTYITTDGQYTISRFAVSPDDPDRADPVSEELIMAFEQPSEQHAAGSITFGPRDGYLYIAVGEGRYAEPPHQTAQETDKLYGKILRIDVSPDAKPYALPADNPFVGSPGHAPEVWALGLRNPWGIAFDRHSGALFIPDTGQFTREEVNYQPPGSQGGVNYGWPQWEGEICAENCALDNLTLPVTSYGKDNGCAVVGGAVHKGRFIYADLCSGGIWSLYRNDQSEWATELVTRLKVIISSIGVDEEGNVYAIGYTDGTIYHILRP